MDEGVSSEVQERIQQHREERSSHDGTLVVDADEAYVGDTITFKGRNLPENTEIDVVWHTAEGMWGVLKANEVVGAQYQPRSEHATSVTTDENGRFTEEWQIPEDYGGEHKIELQPASEENGTLAETKLNILPWFEIDRTEAEMGEFFTITGYGLGPNVITNNYQIAWDNGTVGMMTGVQNRGTATAEVRAVGPPGKHVLQVWRNYRGVPFLQNNTQSPFGPVAGGRKYSWTVEVTEPESEPEAAWLDPMWDEGPLSVHLPDVDEETDAEIEVTPTSGQPGTDAFITGRDFPTETEVDLIWHSHEGHRVKGIDITPEPMPDALPTVTTDEDGAFQAEVTIPKDIGATRPITAEIDGSSVAVTGFMMQPKIETFTPTEGPVGTEIEIEISGVGWPTYGNAYYFVYDNKPLGYICGLEAAVNRTVLQAAGEPGWHFIDVYPSFFKVQEDEPDFELKPHLSYLDNHPIRPLPAAHFAFKITE